jgi:hypothetical protein
VHQGLSQFGYPRVSHTILSLAFFR